MRFQKLDFVEEKWNKPHYIVHYHIEAEKYFHQLLVVDYYIESPLQAQYQNLKNIQKWQHMEYQEL